MYMCTVLLPPVVIPTAVNKYIHLNINNIINEKSVHFVGSYYT